MASLAKEHLDEAIVLLSSTTVVAIFYILIFILYCLSFRLSYAQLRDDHGKIKKKTAWTMVFQLVLLICATLDVIVRNRNVQVMFIENNTLLGGPLGLRSQLRVGSLIRLDSIVNTVEDLLILGVLLWRVRIIWSGTRLVIPLTMISLFLYVGNAGFAVSYRVIAWNSGSTNLVTTPQVEAAIFITALVFSMASSIFMTSTIIARLLFTRRKHIRLMGKSDIAGQYIGIVAMLIESYALDTLWTIGSLISFGLAYAPTNNFFNICLIQVDILTNFLVVYRVLSGRAWDKQTGDRLSTLRWASAGHGTTTTGTVDLRQMNTILEEDSPMMSSRNDV